MPSDVLNQIEADAHLSLMPPAVTFWNHYFVVEFLSNDLTFESHIEIDDFHNKILQYEYIWQQLQYS